MSQLDSKIVVNILGMAQAVPFNYYFSDYMFEFIKKKFNKRKNTV
jgi:hypothetical protein